MAVIYRVRSIESKLKRVAKEYVLVEVETSGIGECEVRLFGCKIEQIPDYLNCDYVVVDVDGTVHRKWHKFDAMEREG